MSTAADAMATAIVMVCGACDALSMPARTLSKASGAVPAGIFMLSKGVALVSREIFRFSSGLDALAW